MGQLADDQKAFAVHALLRGFCSQQRMTPCTPPLDCHLANRLSRCELRDRLGSLQMTFCCCQHLLWVTWWVCGEMRPDHYTRLLWAGTRYGARRRFTLMPAGIRVRREQRTRLGHGVLGQLAGQDEAHGRLDLTARDRRLLVVPGQRL